MCIVKSGCNCPNGIQNQTENWQNCVKIFREDDNKLVGVDVTSPAQKLLFSRSSEAFLVKTPTDFWKLDIKYDKITRI